MATTSTSTSETKINDDTTFYQPSNHTPSELIVLCTWLGASPKHISKYIALYQEIAPSTPILVIQSSVKTITRPYPTQRQHMSDALTIVQNTLSNASSKAAPKILIHTFSNGGSNSATQLLLTHHEKTGKTLPLQGMICDSGPAKGEYWKSYNSMIHSLPKGLLFTLVGGFMAHFILLWMGISSRYLGRYPIFEVLIRDTLIDPQMVSGRGGGKGMKRRINYLWSKEDEMVEWRDVVEHAEEAKGMGWEVASTEFVGSGHCGHLRVGRERYEEVVRGMWKD